MAEWDIEQVMLKIRSKVKVVNQPACLDILIKHEFTSDDQITVEVLGETLQQVAALTIELGLDTRLYERVKKAYEQAQHQTTLMDEIHRLALQSANDNDSPESFPHIFEARR